MKKPYRMLVCDAIENLGRIEELCSLLLETLRKIGMLEQDGVVRNGQLKSSVGEMHGMIKAIERNYRHENYDGIVKQLGLIGDRCASIKDEFRRKL